MSQVMTKRGMKEVPQKLIDLLKRPEVAEDPELAQIIYDLWLGQYNLPLTRSELEYQKEIKELETHNGRKA